MDKDNSDAPNERTPILIKGNADDNHGKGIIYHTAGNLRNSSLHAVDKIPSYKDIVKKRPSVTFVSIITVVLGVCNFVLLKITYSAFGTKYAYFASQMVNFLYLIFGGVALIVPLYITSEITYQERQISKMKFFYMGLLDSFGGFLTAIGSIRTSGQMQTAINQTLLPLTMLTSYFFLNTVYTRAQIYSATVILLGCSLSVIPSILESEEAQFKKIQLFSVSLYFLSNIPMALSSCYKEYHFNEAVIHVLYLTQWVSIWQFVLGFLYFPLLAFYPSSGEHNKDFSTIVNEFYHGLDCYLERIPKCEERGTFLLLTSYTIINFVLNLFSLFLTKHGSAVLNTITFTAIIPCTAVAFSAPILGEFREELSEYSILGIVVIVVGFFGYQTNTPIAKAELSAEELVQLPGSKVQSAFHERMIGLEAIAGVVEA